MGVIFSHEQCITSWNRCDFHRFILPEIGKSHLEVEILRILEVENSVNDGVVFQRLKICLDGLIDSPPYIEAPLTLLRKLPDVKRIPLNRY